MSRDFLERLFWACSDDEKHSADGMDLCELYEKSDEARRGWDYFAKAISSLGLALEDENKVSNIACSLMEVCEKQGFINGFRLGMKLAGELGEGTADHD